ANVTPSGVGSDAFRYHASPRRRTWAISTFAFAACAREMTAETSAAELSVVLNVSTKNARYCGPAFAEVCPVASRTAASVSMARTAAMAARRRVDNGSREMSGLIVAASSGAGYYGEPIIDNERGGHEPRAGQRGPIPPR